MRAVSIASFLLASLAVALAPAVMTVYREAFPAEAAKRAALAACARADPGFDRLIASDRAQCYARRLPAAETPQPVPRRGEIASAAMHPLF